MQTTLQDDLKKDVQKLSPVQRQELQQWAESIQRIQKDEKIPKRKKLIIIVKESKKSSFKHIWWFITELLKHYWKTSSWSIRLFLLSIPAAAIIGGNKRVGIATSGFAIGVPVFLLTSAGITFIGVLLDVLNNANDSIKNTTTEYNRQNNFNVTAPFDTPSVN